MEQELQDGEAAILSQRVTAPAPQHTTTTSLGELKDQLQTELQQGLMGEIKKEIMEQIKALSANLIGEMRLQLSTREVQSTPTSQPMDHHTSVPWVRQQLAGMTALVYQWYAQGKPICRGCGAAGHVQHQCTCTPPSSQDF